MKGSLFDVAGVIIFVFIAGVTLFMMYYFLTQFTAVAGTVPMISTNANAMSTLTKGESALAGMDSLFAFAVFMTCIGTIISAFLSPVHPALFIVFLLVTMILVPVAAMVANMFEEMYSTGPLATAGVSANFPMVLFVFQWLPKITVGASALIAIVMYAFGGRRNAY